MNLILIFFLSFGYSMDIVNSDKSELLCKRWEYVSSFDPYNGGTEYHADAQIKEYMIFHKDGTFESIDEWNHWIGHWKLNSDETAFGIRPTDPNNPLQQDTSDYSYRRNITTLNESELCFWIQGRHGNVTYKYKAVK